MKKVGVPVQGVYILMRSVVHGLTCVRSALMARADSRRLT